jgi:hypothetical protein
MRTNLIKWVHGHLHVVCLDTRVVGLDADLDRVVDDTLNADHHTHISRELALHRHWRQPANGPHEHIAQVMKNVVELLDEKGRATPEGGQATRDVSTLDRVNASHAAA